MVGARGTLLPLRLSQLGASGVGGGVTFVISSLVRDRGSSPVIGRVVDRRGARGSRACVGLLVTAVLVALLPFPSSSALVLAVLVVAALGGPSLAFGVAIDLRCD